MTFKIFSRKPVIFHILYVPK